MTTNAVEQPKVVSREEWLVARKELLAKEKELTRQRDAINAKRRELPWVKIDKEYVFDTPEGKKTLADLFAGRSQLIIRHFMFGPDWKEGCVGCSFASDHVEGALVHLEHHDVSYVTVSRAPLAEIEDFKKRMGWSFPWVSSFENDFNYDYHVSFTDEEIAQREAFYNFERRALPFPSRELSGLSVFYKDASGDIFHTYSCHARGDEGGLTTYFYLDLTPKGRNETGPGHNLGDWVRHHDRYEAGGFVDASGRYHAKESKGECCSAEEAKA
ncbi:MAG: thioredoxin family protein [Candidatus Acidiferrum sp.]